MGFYEVYSHPLLIRYKASVCSRASVFVLVVYLLTYIPPLLITYRSQGKELTPRLSLTSHRHRDQTGHETHSVKEYTETSRARNRHVEK